MKDNTEEIRGLLKKAEEFVKDAKNDFTYGRIKSGGCVEDYVKALDVIVKFCTYLKGDE